MPREITRLERELSSRSVIVQSCRVSAIMVRTIDSPSLEKEQEVQAHNSILPLTVIVVQRVLEIDLRASGKAIMLHALAYVCESPGLGEVSGLDVDPEGNNLSQHQRSSNEPVREKSESKPCRSPPGKRRRLSIAHPLRVASQPPAAACHCAGHIDM